MTACLLYDKIHKNQTENLLHLMLYFSKIRKRCRKVLTKPGKMRIIFFVANASVGRQRTISGCSAVLVARLNGVQEAVSSILATRTR